MTVFPRGDWFGLAVFDPGPGWRQHQLTLLESVDSTSDFLLGRGRQAPGRICQWDGWGWQAGALRLLPPIRGVVPGQIVAARRQLRGRGRQGRRWLSGGLQISWVQSTTRESLEAGLAVWTGLVVTLALREQFGLPVVLKWPNDLMVSGRKLGGILLDTEGGAARPLVAVGLGLNLVLPQADLPPGLHDKMTSIQVESGRRLRPGVVAGPVLARLAAEHPRFQLSGWVPYARQLDQLDCLKGRHVQLTSGGQTRRGRVIGIDAGGALQLEGPRGQTTRIVAGDVHLQEISGREDQDAQGPAR